MGGILGRRRGNSITEILISLSLLSLVVTGGFSVLLNGFSASRQGETCYQASVSARFLQEELKNYVTADTRVTQGAPGQPAWHLPSDDCGSGDRAGAGCWALDTTVTHDVTPLLPTNYWNRYQGRMSYTVTIPPGEQNPPAGRPPMRDVRIQVRWVDPEQPNANPAPIPCPNMGQGS